MSKLPDNLLAIKNEIQPTQLVLSTVPESNIVAKDKIQQVNDIIRKFATDNNLPIVDVNKDVVLKSDEYRTDGHYTANGYSKIAQDITNHIT